MCNDCGPSNADLEHLPGPGVPEILDSAARVHTVESRPDPDPYGGCDEGKLVSESAKTLGLDGAE